MAVLLYSAPGPLAPWLEALRAELPGMEVRTPETPGDPADIDFLVAGPTPPGAFAPYPNLRLIVCLLAGVERMLRDPTLPGVPIVRAGAPDGDPMITEFAALHVLRHHRGMPFFAQAQQRGEWAQRKPKKTAERSVGFMGLGNVGLPAAAQVRDLGFRVRGWSRTARTVPGIECFHGPDGLAPFLAASEIVVNLLALTAETENILRAETFALLPEGASVINLGRGHHIVDDDLIAALDSGRLEHATLDVFREEPLPAKHPFWRHPGITVTPHSSRQIQADRIVPQAAENIRRVLRGEPPEQVVDRAAGY